MKLCHIFQVIRVEAQDDDCSPKYGDICSYEIESPGQPFTISNEGEYEKQNSNLFRLSGLKQLKHLFALSGIRRESSMVSNAIMHGALEMKTNRRYSK